MSGSDHCPITTRHLSVLAGIAPKRPVLEDLSDVETGPLVAPVLRWGRGRTVRALFSLQALAALPGKGSSRTPAGTTRSRPSLA
jgi:hypothetical protein